MSETSPLIPTVSRGSLTSHVKLPSLQKRILQVSCAIVWCLLAAGPVFGFAALKSVLISQGVYENVCVLTNTTISETFDKSNIYPLTALKEPLCIEQDLKLNFMFTMAAVITNATALVVGSILDNYGPRVTGIIGSGIILVATLVFINATKISHSHLFDPYLVGYVLLAFGGPFTFISSFQLANSFPGNSGLVLALLTGAFDTSSALFLGYRIVYTNDWLIHDFTIEKFFKIYLIVPVFIFLCQYFIMPHESYKTVETLAKIGESGIDETGEPIDPNDSRYQPDEVNEMLFSPGSSGNINNLGNNNAIGGNRSRRASIKSTKSVFEEIADRQLTKKSGGIFGVLHDKSVIEQLKTPWFYIMALFTTIQMLRINYFVATIKSQELYLFGDLETATTINKFFDLALPMGGVIAIPFIGLLLDNYKTLTVLTLLLFTSLTIGICGIIPWLPTAYLGIILLVIYRPFYYTAVSDYSAKVFGYKTFGTVYGTIICFSGVWNVAQTGLDYLTHQTFHLNPIPVNCFLVFLTALFGFSMVIYIRMQEEKLKHDSLVAEAMNSEEVTVPI